MFLLFFGDVYLKQCNILFLNGFCCLNLFKLLSPVVTNEIYDFNMFVYISIIE